MRILYCNVGLSARSGSEVVTLETARMLSSFGHDICIYTSVTGASSMQLAAGGIDVLTDLDDLPWQPDVIHSNHLPQSIEAAARCPGTPQIFICHDATTWHSQPPALSIIRQWVAVDEICAERIVRVISPSSPVVRLPNAVDMDVYRRRPPLPATGRRALALVKHRSHLAAIETACRQANLTLDVFGSATNNAVDDLPTRLPHYDIVFATGRMALEAMSAGCSVIVVDGRGLAGTVTSKNVKEWRRNNFGQRLLTHPVTVDGLYREIGRYDNLDASLVSDFIRANASLSAYCDRLIDLYTAAIADFEQAPTEPSLTLREVFAATLMFFDETLKSVSPVCAAETSALALYQFRQRIETDLCKLRSRNFLMRQFIKTAAQKWTPRRFGGRPKSGR